MKDPRIELAAAEFVLLRRMKVKAKKARHDALIKCEDYGDPTEPDFRSGGGPCALNKDTRGDDQCEHCRACEVHHNEFIALSRQTASALRKLDRAVAAAGYPVE